MLRRTRRLAAALLVVPVCALAACGDDDPASVDPTATTSPAPPSTTTTTAAADGTTTTAVDGEGISELEALAADLLVVPVELGAPAEDQGYVPPEPPPCGFDLDADVPADVHVGTALRMADGTFVEVLRVYTDADVAAAAYEAAVEHEASCSFEGRAAAGPTDVNDRVGADDAVQFAATDGGGTRVRIIARVADALVTFTVDGPAAVAVDPVEAAAFGVGKIIAALEA